MVDHDRRHRTRSVVHEVVNTELEVTTVPFAKNSTWINFKLSNIRNHDISINICCTTTLELSVEIYDNESQRRHRFADRRCERFTLKWFTDMLLPLTNATLSNAVRSYGRPVLQLMCNELVNHVSFYFGL